MNTRWASIKLTLVLLYLGVLPLAPELPLPFVFASLALTLVAAAPQILGIVGALCSVWFAPAQVIELRTSSPEAWLPQLPLAPGTPGTVRARAPSGLLAAHA